MTIGTKWFHDQVKVLADSSFQVSHLVHCNMLGVRCVDLTTLSFVLSPVATGKFESHMGFEFSGDSTCIRVEFCLVTE